MNQLFNVLGGGNLSPFLQRFNQFKTMFSGDPRAQVQQMLNSGQVTQDQYNRAAQMATQLQRMMR